MRRGFRRRLPQGLGGQRLINLLKPQPAAADSGGCARLFLFRGRRLWFVAGLRHVTDHSLERANFKRRTLLAADDNGDRA